MQDPIKKPLPKLIRADDLKHIPEEELVAVEGQPLTRWKKPRKPKKANQRIVLATLQGFEQGREAWWVAQATDLTLATTLKLLGKLVKRGFVIGGAGHYILTKAGIEVLKN